MCNKDFVEGIHFYYDESNFLVFTQKYHLQRGYCCGNGCRHCPYEYEKVPEPERGRLIAQKRDEKKKN